MSSQYVLKISGDEAKEMPMVDLAFHILKAAGKPFYYRDLMNEIAQIKEISEEQVLDVIAQLYTEINIDGRFACVGSNLWGLKRWYPLDKAEEMGELRPRIINDDNDDDDLDVEEDLFDDDEDLNGDDDEDEDAEDDEDFDGDDEDADLDEELEDDEEYDGDEDTEDDNDDEEEDPDDTDRP